MARWGETEFSVCICFRRKPCFSYCPELRIRFVFYGPWPPTACLGEHPFVWQEVSGLARVLQGPVEKSLCVPFCAPPPGPPRAVRPRVYDHASPSCRQGTPRCALRADGRAFLGRAGPVEPGGDGNEKEMRLWLFPLGIPRMWPCSPSAQRPGFLLFLL